MLYSVFSVYSVYSVYSVFSVSPIFLSSQAKPNAFRSRSRN